MFKDYSDLVSTEELCEALGIGRNTAYHLLNSGQIKAFKCGKAWKNPTGSRGAVCTITEWAVKLTPVCFLLDGVVGGLFFTWILQKGFL